MSGKRDNSLSKDFDFKNTDEMDRIYQGYQPVMLPGHFCKSVLRYFLRIYKGCCGESEGINRVYHALSQYTDIRVADDAYTFADEAAKLQDLYLLANDYASELNEVSRQLDVVIDRWLGSIHSDKLNEKQRAEDVKLVAQSALIMNRRAFVHTMSEYANALMNGSFRYEDVREANGEDMSLDSFALPLFTHVPVAEDFSQKSLSESKLMQILCNLTEQDSYAPMRMMHDCNNGKAIVRLWKKENGLDKPCLFVISKRDVYLERIGYSREKSLWPGFAETAIRHLNCLPEEIPYAILGPELEKFDLPALLGPNVPAVYETDRSYNDMVREYITCYYDAYSAFLGVQSLIIKDTVEYTRLMMAIWEVIYALVCSFDRTFDVIDPAGAFLESAITEYKESVHGGSKTDSVTKKRIAICDTLETILTLGAEDSSYRSNPRLYFETKLAARIAGVLNAKTEDVLSSKTFQRQAAKLNIHVMNTASDEYAKALLTNLKTR